MKLKKGDTVYIAKGKDRGRSGKVLRIFPKSLAVVVDGVNIRKRHVRPRTGKEKGQIVEVPSSIPATNVRMMCTNCKKPARLKFRRDEKGIVRICAKCEHSI